MKANPLKLIVAGLLFGVIGTIASCDQYTEKKPDTYGQQPLPKCEKVTPTPVPVSQVPTDAERNACSAAGGSVEQGGLAGGFGCVLPYCDGGDACSDSSECIGRCYATGTPGPIGSPATGACQPNSSPFGCRTEIVAGQLGPTLCVD